MADQEYINYGAAPNDGSGDPLRDAFIKVDNNFSAIWNAGPVGSNVTILNNTIGVINTNGNLTLSPNGVGVIETKNHVVPWANNVNDLGTANLYYRRAYIGTGGITVAGNIVPNAIYTNNYFYANGVPFSGNGGGGGNGQAIVNGNSNVAITTPGGNVNFGINGTANVVTVSETALFVNGVIATPRTLSANITIDDNVSAMMVSPLTIPDGLSITVPPTSVFNIVP